MSFIELAKQRYSCRKYLDKPVEKDKLMQILEAGRIAPSAANYQPWHFVVIQDKNNLEKIRSCYTRDWFKQAPVVLVICCDHRNSWKRSYDNKVLSNIDDA